MSRARCGSRVGSRSNSASAAKVPNKRRPAAGVVPICGPWPASTHPQAHAAGRQVLLGVDQMGEAPAQVIRAGCSRKLARRTTTHAAAVLYGVGSRLDERPELLFRLRDVDAEDLVVGDMALPDASAGDDVLAGDLADIFGIDLDPADSGAAAARQRTTGRRRPRRRRPRRTGAPPSGFQPTGRRVAELRHQGGFSVPEFAGLLRVSASTVYRWEAARGPLALRAGQEDALQVLYRAIEKRQT